MLTVNMDIMKHNPNPNPKRGRSRGNGKRGPSHKGQNFESSGSDNKIRGSAQQVLDKYLILARDAASAGDRIASENFHQYAEHYFRVVHANDTPSVQGGQGSQGRPPHSNRRDGENDSPDQPTQAPVNDPVPVDQLPLGEQNPRPRPKAKPKPKPEPEPEPSTD